MKGFQKCFCTRRLCTYTYFYGIRIWKKTYYHKIINEYKKLANLLSYCDVRKCTPATGNLKVIQDKETILLKKLTTILNRAKAIYWLDFGSLLGLYRHNGFIPWDDDIDLCMIRSDLERVLPMIKRGLSGTNYVVREIGKCDHYQIRIHEKNAEYIGIDIFHVDAANNVTDVKKLNTQIKSAYKKLSHQIKRLHGHTENIRNVIQNITEKQIIKTTNTISNNTIFFYGIDYPHTDHPILTIKYDELFPLKKINFLGCTVNIPNKTKERLECLYGKDFDDFPRFLFDSYILGNKKHFSNDT